MVRSADSGMKQSSSGSSPDNAKLVARSVASFLHDQEVVCFAAAVITGLRSRLSGGPGIFSFVDK